MGKRKYAQIESSFFTLETAVGKDYYWSGSCGEIVFFNCCFQGEEWPFNLNFCSLDVHEKSLKSGEIKIWTPATPWQLGKLHLWRKIKYVVKKCIYLFMHLLGSFGLIIVKCRDAVYKKYCCSPFKIQNVQLFIMKFKHRHIICFFPDRNDGGYDLCVLVALTQYPVQVMSQHKELIFI